ncbi:hypothetical protein BDZ90DRAFT_106248 [Jaminaea rosea]|uniref:Uncharacterized protein n=1 Tax=Jaminaea rosea TaxID=1569628 RepID=A0A316UVM8_9BASI|nr:hypothetical protein BDZ90DRAFT_106248 [Jaminaea rosea]PWN29350.1 hypothetical protein BDZ90DRAFT_106248 [Jaminaea rosea]
MRESSMGGNLAGRGREQMGDGEVGWRGWMFGCASALARAGKLRGNQHPTRLAFAGRHKGG